jgi:hypothetical protein
VLRVPTDLEFNPAQPNELWVVNHADDSAVIITEPGDPMMKFERRRDPAAGHFMDNPPALAFGGASDFGQTFAVCGDSDDGGDDFMGPALFSAALDVFAESTPGGLGSHLDMLHSTTFCRGIAHAEANVYFVFNSTKGSIDKYDFHANHVPGAEDHSDGQIYRYVSGTLVGVDGIPSHVAFDPSSKELFVADTGHGRLVALDTTSGTIGERFAGDEPVVRRIVDNATLREVVAPGALVHPSGIELSRGLVLVADDETSRFYAYDAEGTLVRELDSGLPPGSLAGITVGRDGKLYFVDMLGGRVMRVEPRIDTR